MKSFSLKPSVEALDIEVDGNQVFVRQLTAGDKVQLSEMMGSMATIAAQVKSQAEDDEDADSLGKAASNLLSADQYQSFMTYQAETVFLRWCDKNGKRKFTEKAKFNEVPAELVDAIYSESAKADPDEAEAKGNS